MGLIRLEGSYLRPRTQGSLVLRKDFALVGLAPASGPREQAEWGYPWARLSALEPVSSQDKQKVITTEKVQSLSVHSLDS